VVATDDPSDLPCSIFVLPEVNKLRLANGLRVRLPRVAKNGEHRFPLHHSWRWDIPQMSPERVLWSLCRGCCLTPSMVVCRETSETADSLCVDASKRNKKRSYKEQHSQQSHGLFHAGDSLPRNTRSWLYVRTGLMVPHRAKPSGERRPGCCRQSDKLGPVGAS
jgi:hypothetical protein